LNEHNINYLGVEFQDCTIIWHIAIDIFIAKSSGEDAHHAEDLVKAIRMLSNYIIVNTRLICALVIHFVMSDCQRDP